MMTEQADIRDRRGSRFAGIVSLVRRFLEFFVTPGVYRVLLTLVSAATTWWGITLIYDAIGAGAEGALGLLKYVLPVAVAGFLHCTIFWTLYQWTSVRRWRYLALAIPLQALAALSSYTTHWVHLNGDAETAGAFTEAQSTVVRGAIHFAQSYRTVGEAMERLAAHSNAQAEIEERKGNSCQTSAGTGQGPRYDLRKADAAVFSAFQAQVSGRVKRIDELVARIDALTAMTSADAMSNLPALRRALDEIKAFEGDPLLVQLRSVAEQRLAKGRGPIAIPASQRGVNKATSFTCTDPLLDRHLATVIEATRALKPVPDIRVVDARDPREGAVLALQRLWGSVIRGEVPTLSVEALKRARTRELTASGKVDDGLRPRDVSALGLAALVELMLLVAFLIGNRRHIDHPGLDPLAESLARRRSRIFEQAWRQVGGGSTGLAAMLDRHMMYEHRSTLVVVPLYTEAPEEHALHRMMELLVGVGFARRLYTGWLFVRLFTVGWPRASREASLRKGHVRVYRLDERDHHALILDSLGEGAAVPPVPPGGEGTVVYLPAPEPRRAA